MNLLSYCFLSLLSFCPKYYYFLYEIFNIKLGAVVLLFMYLYFVLQNVWNCVKYKNHIFFFKLNGEILFIFLTLSSVFTNRLGICDRTNVQMLLFEIKLSYLHDYFFGIRDTLLIRFIDTFSFKIYKIPKMEKLATLTKQ